LKKLIDTKNNLKRKENNMTNANNKKQNKRQCPIERQGILKIDYKDIELLNKFISYNGKIKPRRITGVSQKNQRMISNAIKRARLVALLPFVKE
jgi:small subunit ribosomal protein S18